MPKHRWHKSFKSFMKGHIDPEKDEELKETRAEVESTVRKILDLVKADSEDGNEPLAELIEGFYGQYQSLYARYDHLTGELRDKVNNKQGKESSSSSSDSDSDSDSTQRKKKGQNGNAKNELEKVKQQLETANAEVSGLTSKLKVAVEENEALNFDYQSVIHKVQEADEIIKDLNDKAERWNDEKSKLLAENADFSLKLESAGEEKEGMRGKISEMEKELIEKESELSVLQKKFEDGETEAAEQTTALTEQVSDLQGKLDSQKIELDLEREKRNGEIAEYLVQIENSKEEIASKSVDGERMVEEIESLKMQVKSLEMEVESFREQNDKLEETINQLKEENEKQAKETSKAFQEKMDAKKQKIDELEETIDDLKRDLEIKGDEMNTLVEYVRTLEVKLRLSTQKTRVTEQLLSEKDDDYQTKEEKLQQEKKFLEERTATLLEIISVYKKAQLKIVTDVSEKVNLTLNRMESFNMKFEEDYGHLESRVYEIVNELKVASNWVKEANSEKEFIEKEITKVAQQLEIEKEQELTLRDRVAKLETSLSNEEKNVNQLEESKGQLLKEVQEKDEKIIELETKMKEKDLGITDLSEEKREAIRQLCVWIDYHRDRYDNLREMVLKTTGGRRQTTA